MKYNNKAQLISGTTLLGNVTGIVIGIKRKSGFLGTVGWFFLAGLAGAAVGYIITSSIPDTDDNKN